MTVSDTPPAPGRDPVGTSTLEEPATVDKAELAAAPAVLATSFHDYVRITSGLGEAPPNRLIVLPALFEGQVMAVIELASFQDFSPTHQAFLEQLMESVGVVLNVIAQNARTEELLVQSQQLTQELQAQSEELQSQQDELRRSNVELEHQAQTLKASEELLQQQQEELRGKGRAHEPRPPAIAHSSSGTSTART